MLQVLKVLRCNSLNCIHLIDSSFLMGCVLQKVSILMDQIFLIATYFRVSYTYFYMWFGAGKRRICTLLFSFWICTLAFLDKVVCIELKPCFSTIRVQSLNDLLFRIFGYSGVFFVLFFYFYALAHRIVIHICSLA